MVICTSHCNNTSFPVCKYIYIRVYTHTPCTGTRQWCDEHGSTSHLLFLSLCVHVVLLYNVRNMFHILHVFWHHFFCPIVLFYICIKPDANSSPFPYPLCKKAFSLFLSVFFQTTLYRNIDRFVQRIFVFNYFSHDYKEALCYCK